MGESEKVERTQSDAASETVLPKNFQERIEGAIFDLDGTLLDSMGLWLEIDRLFLSKRGIEIPNDYAQAVNAMSFGAAAEYTVRRFGLDAAPESLINEWNGMAEEAYRSRIRLKPNAGRFLRALDACGIKLGVATALDPSLADACLRHNGVLDLFCASVSLRHVARGKEFPDVYIACAKKMGVLPNTCAVFEDLPVGIDSARRGGFFTVGVFDSHATEDDTKKIRACADRFLFEFPDSF